MADPGKSIAGWAQPPFRFAGLGMAPTVAHSDIVTNSLAGPGVAATAARSDVVTASLAGPGVATTPARSDIVPIGVPWPWLTGTPPNGFILMDGSNVSRTTYAPLFALWGTTFGAGDGSTTFGLPDFRGRAIIGAGTGSGLTSRMLNATGGEETHVLLEAELANHMHVTHSTGSTDTLHTHSGVGGFSEIASPNAANVNNINTDGAGANTAHNNMQPFFVVNWIVRAA